MLHTSVRQLIADRYAAAHGARPAIDYPAYCVLDGTGGPKAALGYRRAADGPLFLERYLDAPVESTLGERLGREVARDAVVEIGDHASGQAHATIRLWAVTAERLAGEAELAVAVLTADLRRMFHRMGLAIVELAPACPERLGAGSAAWGRYYDRQPVVCAGEILPARAALRRWLRLAEAAA